MSKRQELTNAINKFTELCNYLEGELERRRPLTGTWKLYKITRSERLEINNPKKREEFSSGIITNRNILDWARLHSLYKIQQEIEKQRLRNLDNNHNTLQRLFRSLRQFKFNDGARDIAACEKITKVIEQRSGKLWEFMILLILIRQGIAAQTTGHDFTNCEKGLPLHEASSDQTLYLWYKPNSKILSRVFAEGSPKLTGVKPDFFFTKQDDPTSSPYAMIECKASSFSSASFYKLWGQARYLKVSRAILLPFKERVDISNAKSEDDFIQINIKDEGPTKDTDLVLLSLKTPKFGPSRSSNSMIRWTTWYKTLFSYLNIRESDLNI